MSERRPSRWVILALAPLLLAGCGSSDDLASVSKRVSDLENTPAECVKAGVQEMAAERTRIYRCTWVPLENNTVSPCYAILDGELLDVTDRADSAFECSHVPIPG